MIEDIQRQEQEYIWEMEAKGVIPSKEDIKNFMGSVIDN